jgi:hypothetical protein
MKSHGESPRHPEVLARLSLLPRKMIRCYSAQHMSEFVFHELCHLQCFDLGKAAYFVDNPDFDCLQGVAGYDKAEHTAHHDLDCHSDFADHLGECTFNKKIRGLSKKSFKRAKISERDILKEFTQALAMQDACVYVWPLKHDNYGIIIYERSPCPEDLHEHIKNGLHFLSFCSLF